jgi:hypothetical protein
MPPKERSILRLHGGGSIEPYVNYSIYEKVCEIIASLDLPTVWKTAWSAQVKNSFGYGSAAVLLALLPNVATLCISDPASQLIFSEANFEPKADSSDSSFRRLPLRLPTMLALSYVKYESPLPPSLKGLQHFPNLYTLDLSIRLQGQIASQVRRASECYLYSRCEQPTIQRLRLDFEVRTVGIWNTTSRACMTNMLRGFPNLQTLEYYAESSDSKNPYRSVRAFPAYQANIQHYPEISSSFVDEFVLDEQHWDHAIYDARTEVTDYQNLVDGMVHLRPTLQVLQLPGGFWTLPGAVRKPLPRFDQFAQLKKLIVPQAALISIKLDNMRFDAVFEGDFELLPTQALPTYLQHLKIFDVEVAFLESKWLQHLFREQHATNHWPVLGRVDILMGPTVTKSTLEDLKARRSDAEFWKLADDANFRVVVGRDEEGPDV